MGLGIDMGVKLVAILASTSRLKTRLRGAAGCGQSASAWDPYQVESFNQGRAVLE